MNIPEMATAFYKKGLEPTPCSPGKKYYQGVDWMRLNLPVTPWPANHGISFRTGPNTITPVDIDIYDSGTVISLLSAFDFPHLVRIGQPPKALVPVVCAEIREKLLSDAYVDENGVINRIEILSHGQQFVAYGIHPDTGKPYQWSGDLLTHSLPVVSKNFILHLFDLFYDLACKKGWRNISAREKQAEKRVSMRIPTNRGNAPGSIYNRAVSLHTVLEHYGWTHYKGQYWTRPDKKTGVSASVFDDRILWPFTSSTCLAPDKPYDAFEILTQYEFRGDKSACARALRKAA